VKNASLFTVPCGRVTAAHRLDESFLIGISASGTIQIVNNGGGLTSTYTGKGTMTIRNKCTAFVTVTNTGNGRVTVNATGSVPITITHSGDADFIYP
jgi:hypothetical protein